MPTALPQSVRSVLGEQPSHDLEEWIVPLIQEHAVSRDEFREIRTQLEIVKTRLDGVEEGLADIRIELRESRRETNARFDQMNAQFNARTDSINERFDRLNGRFDQMHEQMRVMMRWTVGAIILIGAIITVLLAVAEFAA